MKREKNETKEDEWFGLMVAQNKNSVKLLLERIYCVAERRPTSGTKIVFII